MAKASTYTALTAMQPSTQVTSTTTGSITLPAQCSAFLIGVETNDARMTFDGTAPTSTTGIKVPKDNPPILILVGAPPNAGSGTTQKLQFIGNAAGNCTPTVIPLA